MISVEEARKRLYDYSERTEIVNVQLEDAIGCHLAEDVISPTDNPPFNQSAVDGYGIVFTEYPENAYKLVDEIPAGKKSEYAINAEETVRIFTGAEVPESVTAIIMQEDLKEENGFNITFEKKALKLYQNIRKKAEQIKKNELAMEKGSYLNPPAIGFLASIGVKELKIYKKPSIKIIVTGSELINDIEDFKNGKIFESNGKMLKAALASNGFNSEFVHVEDDPELLKNKISELMTQSDLLILSGGVSVGDYDFTVEALEANGFKTIFHKISQKPGKPLLFSKNREKFAFGLPGNPRAALMCFYVYIHPFIKMMTGSINPFPITLQLPITHDYHKKGNRLNFVIGNIENNQVRILSGQGSHMLKSFSEGELIVEIPPDAEYLEKGRMVKAYVFT